MKKPHHPTTLEISIGGFMGPSYHLKWNGEHLIYRAFEDQMEPNAEFHLTPSKRQWESFWKTLDTIGVWNWQDTFRGNNHPTRIGSANKSSGNGNAMPSVVTRPIAV